MESHFDLDTALGKATGDHSSIHPKRTTMVAKKGDDDIELENDSPMLEGSDSDTVEGRTNLLLQVLAARMTLVC